MTSEPAPLLPELCASVSPFPEGVDTATALIATVPPKQLRASVSKTIVESFSAQLGADDRMAQEAENLFERTVQHPNSRSARRLAREFLENALAGQQAAADRYQELAPALMLAKEVNAKQFKLSKPMRWISAITLSLALGGGATYETYEAAHSSNKDAIAMTIQDNKKYPDFKQPIPKESLDEGQKIVTGLIGLMGTYMGAMGGVFLGVGLSDRYARRRAKHIVSKAQKF